MPIKITDYITTTDPSDTYATHDSFLGKGGFREVSNNAARDNIPLARRVVGMLVITQDTGRVWKLTNAGSNTYVEVVVVEGSITSPIDGQVLEYDSGTGKWINATPTGGGGGASAMADLTDVDFTNPPNVGSMLIFDGVAWIPADFISAGNAGVVAPEVNFLTAGGPELGSPDFGF